MAATPTFVRSTLTDSSNAASRGGRGSETRRPDLGRATDDASAALPILEPKWIAAIEKATD